MTSNSGYIIKSYIIFNLIIALNICLLLLNKTFYVNTINFVNVNIWLIILFCNLLTCSFYLNFVFICNSKIRILIWNINHISFKLIPIFLSNFYEFLLKQINPYFVNRNIISCRRNHVLKISCNSFIIFNFFPCLYCIFTHSRRLQIQWKLFFLIVRIFLVDLRWKRITILMKQRIFAKSLRFHCLFRFFFKLLMIFVPLKSFLLIELLNLKFFISLMKKNRMCKI